MQVRREIARGPRTKQDNRGLVLGSLCGHCLCDGFEPKAAQEVTLGIGESHRVGTQIKIASAFANSRMSLVAENFPAVTISAIHSPGRWPM